LRIRSSKKFIRFERSCWKIMAARRDTPSTFDSSKANWRIGS